MPSGEVDAYPSRVPSKSKHMASTISLSESSPKSLWLSSQTIWLISVNNSNWLFANAISPKWRPEVVAAISFCNSSDAKSLVLRVRGRRFRHLFGCLFFLVGVVSGCHFFRMLFNVGASGENFWMSCDIIFRCSFHGCF